MLKVSVQYIVALGKAVKGSATVCNDPFIIVTTGSDTSV